MAPKSHLNRDRRSTSASRTLICKSIQHYNRLVLENGNPNVRRLHWSHISGSPNFISVIIVITARPGSSIILLMSPLVHLYEDLSSRGRSSWEAVIESYTMYLITVHYASLNAMPLPAAEQVPPITSYMLNWLKMPEHKPESPVKGFLVLVSGKSNGDHSGYSRDYPFRRMKSGRS